MFEDGRFGRELVDVRRRRPIVAVAPDVVRSKAVNADEYDWDHTYYKSLKEDNNDVRLDGLRTQMQDSLSTTVASVVNTILDLISERTSRSPAHG